MIVSGSYASYCKYPETYTWFTRISTTDVANGDDVGVWYTLPFQFPFFGEYKSRVYICSNGYLIFDPTVAGTNPSNSQWGLRNSWRIAPFWDDLRTDVSGGYAYTPGVYVDYVAVANCLIITWETTRKGAPSDSIKFQVILARTGDIRISINVATNFNNFSPTLGISKQTLIDFIDITDERSTQKTWTFLYDIDDLFYYDRAGIDAPWPFNDPPTYNCLTSSGYVNYGQCHCGPSVSRDYVPDHFQWEYIANTLFETYLKWDVNLYSSAQSWSGRDLCYVLEYNILREAGTVESWYSNIPDVEWSSVTAETWGGRDTWEMDAHTNHPENLATGTWYHVDLWMSMESGYSIERVIGQESELYDDGWPWGLIWDPGAQRDWFKQYLGDYWIYYGVVRFGCGPPKEIVEHLTFQGGALSVTKPVNSTALQISNMPDTYTYKNLDAYVSARIKSTEELIKNTNPYQYIPATVTFIAPISPHEYVNLAKKLGIEIYNYNVLGTDGYGGSKSSSKQNPYNDQFERELEKRGVKVVGITGFTGSIPANKLLSLQNDSRILLVDPWEDLAVQELKQRYVQEGYSVDVLPTIDLWPEYNAEKTN